MTNRQLFIFTAWGLAFVACWYLFGWARYLEPLYNFVNN